MTIALNSEEIKKDSQKITKIKAFINKINWEGINYPQKKMIGKKLENIA